jgi:hypothetical protein
MADGRGPVVSDSQMPNRYRLIPAVRSSADLRPLFVVLATEEQRGGGARVRRGSLGAHLGQLSGDLAAVVGCGASDGLGDAAGEANFDAARSWACSFTSRCSGDGGDGVGYRRT